MPFGTEKALMMGSGAAVENYFGDGSDGDVTIGLVGKYNTLADSYKSLIDIVTVLFRIIFK